MKISIWHIFAFALIGVALVSIGERFISLGVASLLLTPIAVAVWSVQGKASSVKTPWKHP